MLRIFIDFILKTALEWRVNLTVLRSKFKRIRPVWFLSCSDEVSIIAIMKPEECCRPQSRFFVHSPSCCQRIDRKLCSDLRFLSEVSRSAGWRALIWVYICVFFVKYLCSREIPRCKKKIIGFEDWLIRVSLIVLQILQLVSYQHFTENLELRDRMR